VGSDVGSGGRCGVVGLSGSRGGDSIDLGLFY
jgi:hypothetical protein